MIAPALITTIGFGLGLIFGAVASRTHFCALGAISDALNMGSWTRARQWSTAIAVSILGVWLLQTAAGVDLAASTYAVKRLPWLSIIVGGLMFGAGMVLASGCTSKTLIRLGGGNLKSLVVVLVLAVSAYVTLRGLFAVWRVSSIDRVIVELPVSQTLPALLAATDGALTKGLSAWLAPLIALALLGLIVGRSAFLRDERDERDERGAIAGGAVIGLVVTGAWWTTGWLAYVPEHPETLEPAYLATQLNRPEALSLVGPYAYTLELVMLWSDQSRKLTFGIASALGMVAGSFLHALASGGLRSEIFPDARDFRRHLLGAILMGCGGVLALGCTVGQGLSGLSMLSLGALIATGSIIAGAVLMMRWDYHRLTERD